MSPLEIVLAVGSIISVGIAVAALSMSGRKEQTDLDKDQNNNISDLMTEVSVLQSVQVTLKERISRCEGLYESFDGKIAKEMEKMEEKLEAIRKQMEINNTASQKNMIELMKMISDIKNKKA